jgi:toxin ParE1/3/4
VKLQLHPLANAEAKDAAHWYEDKQIGLGVSFLDRLQECYGKIRRSPQRFAKLETVRLNADIRRCLLPRFPYLIVYEVHDDRIHVLAIAHASRGPNYWLSRRGST